MIRKRGPHPDFPLNPPIQRRRVMTHSGVTSAWRLWRHCCCRHGWYPLLIAPIITVGCMLSLYSASGCDFVRVDIGFTPSNEGWNESGTAELGLFLYQSNETETNRYRAAFLNGCRTYPNAFTYNFIQEDRTWKVTRIMAYVAAGGSILATVTVWLLVFTPLPAFFFWPGVMLPALMAAFLAEGSKFLFFDTAVCRNNIWFPPGTDSRSRHAESCSLGDTGKYAIASVAVLFLSLVAVCFNAPERRHLDPNYGLDVKVERGDHPETSEDYNDTGSERDSYHVSRQKAMEPDVEADESSFTVSSFGYDADPPPNAEHAISRSARDNDDDDLVLHHTSSSGNKRQKPHAQDKDTHLDKYNPRKPLVPTKETDKPLIVSESRLSTAEMLAMNTTPSSSKRELIDKFVSEFEKSFQNNT